VGGSGDQYDGFRHERGRKNQEDEKESESREAALGLDRRESPSARWQIIDPRQAVEGVEGCELRQKSSTGIDVKELLDGWNWVFQKV